ncbi:MAG TPA: phytanoyl-CoA dioxygenase family protein [Tepidisphaeraceae bacterium]|jgi:ectoine hydroxylase-related dioxygenase (phytanoyl-CoA dioxygenase family)
MTPEAVAAGILPEPTIQLTQNQIEHYHREGYMVIEQISTPDEIEKLRVIYDRLFEQKAGRADGAQFDLGGTDEEGKQAVLPQILNPVKYAPELTYGLFRANGLAIAKQLLGPEAIANGEHAIFKPAIHGAETPWHQDEAYWSPALDYNAFSLWMPLQPARLDNGCMQFVPGSHRGEVLPHHSINHDPRIHGLEMDVVPGSDKAVACPLPAGGCTVHHNRTYHYTGPNRSTLPRRAYILMFGLPAKKRTDNRRFPWEEIKQTARTTRAEATSKAATTA